MGDVEKLATGHEDLAMLCAECWRGRGVRQVPKVMVRHQECTSWAGLMSLNFRSVTSSLYDHGQVANSLSLTFSICGLGIAVALSS